MTMTSISGGTQTEAEFSVFVTYAGYGTIMFNCMI